jgi:hypothetical protein
MVLNYAGRSDTYRYVSEASLAEAEERAHPERAQLPKSSDERNALVLAMETTTRRVEPDVE